MNDSGQIVFLCDISINSTPGTSGDNEVCIIDKDGKNFEQITDNTVDEYSPRINNLGQVIYACERTGPSNLCGFTFDNPTPSPITAGNQRIAVGFQTFDINDNGLIVYTCSTGETRNLCTINFDGSEYREILVGGLLDGARPSINNNGLIAYSCNQEHLTGSVFEVDTSICSVNTDGSGGQLRAENYSWPNHPDINDTGMIVYECLREDNRREICIIDPGETEPRYLTDNDMWDTLPSINSEGWIAFTNSQGINIIKHDGTELEVRRDGLSASPSINK